LLRFIAELEVAVKPFIAFPSYVVMNGSKNEGKRSHCFPSCVAMNGNARRVKARTAKKKTKVANQNIIHFCSNLYAAE